tara:strand:- start:256 stop:426 length:171 start_codon:yes stop_codon:yes gene_type:complete
MELVVAGEITAIDLYLTGKKYNAIIDEIIIAKTHAADIINLNLKQNLNKPWILKIE